MARSAPRGAGHPASTFAVSNSTSAATDINSVESDAARTVLVENPISGPFACDPVVPMLDIILPIPHRSIALFLASQRPQMDSWTVTDNADSSLPETVYDGGRQV